MPRISELPSALDCFAQLRLRLSGSVHAIFLDFDGTMSEIAPFPEDAVLLPGLRELLERLAITCPVAAVSGRDRPDLEDRVGVLSMGYAGSHGIDLRDFDGNVHVHEPARAFQNLIEMAADALLPVVERTPGALLELKHFSVAVHFRRVPLAELPALEAAVRSVAAQHPWFRLAPGKAVLEMRPDIDWDKGRAVQWLLGRLPEPDILPLYIGDDITDEDALEVTRNIGIGIVVGRDDRETHAHFTLNDPGEVKHFLARLTDQE